MNPLLVVLGIAAIVALIPRPKANPTLPSAVITTPSAAPPGINTGFSQPPIQASNGNPTPSSAPYQSNVPAPSASGVPVWSSNAQEFAPDDYGLAPSPLTRIPSYYAGPISANLRPAFRPTRVPDTSNDSASCGCGGSCGGNVSLCSITSKRLRDSGCLSPTQQATIANTSPGVLATWAANIASAGGNSYQAHQQYEFDRQDVNPHGDDVTAPASPFIQGIGIHPRRPIHSAVAG